MEKKHQILFIFYEIAKKLEKYTSEKARNFKMHVWYIEEPDSCHLFPNEKRFYLFFWIFLGKKTIYTNQSKKGKKFQMHVWYTAILSLKWT